MRYDTRPRTTGATIAAFAMTALVWTVATPAHAQELPACAPTGSVEVFANIGAVNADGFFTVTFTWEDEPGDRHWAIIVDSDNTGVTVNDPGSVTLDARNAPFRWLGLNERPDGVDYCKGTGVMSPEFTPSQTTTTTVPDQTTTTGPGTPTTTVPDTTSTTAPGAPTTTVPDTTSTTDGNGGGTPTTTSTTVPPVIGGTLPFTGPDDHAGTAALAAMALAFGAWTVHKFRNAGRHTR